MLLSVNDLHVYYGAIHAVKGVSLEVNEGEIVTLIGANGAGKSTVLNTISGLLRAKTGTIEFMGTPINHYGPQQDRPAWPCAVPGGPPRVRTYDRRGKPRNGRIYPSEQLH